VTPERSPRPTEGSIVSRTTARHRKPSHRSCRHPGAAAQRRKPSPIASAVHNKPVRVAAAAVAGSALMVAAWPAATHWMAESRHPAGVDQADALGLATAGARQSPASPAGHGPTQQQPPAAPGVYASQQPKIVSVAVASRPGRHRKPSQAGQAQPGQAPASSGYLNPLRGVSGLVPERVDMGVDFGGAGPVYGLGDAVITNATADNGGWPGGGWITYQLTDGPDAGLVVYVAEDVTPTVQAGQHVTSSTVIATMYNGADGIETGWAMQDGASAESETPQAGGIGGAGPFPTMVGLSFEGLLRSLGVPAASNASESGYGLLPANYPAD
jgi:hypothetical protein